MVRVKIRVIKFHIYSRSKKYNKLFIIKSLKFYVLSGHVGMCKYQLVKPACYNLVSRIYRGNKQELNYLSPFHVRFGFLLSLFVVLQPLPKPAFQSTYLSDSPVVRFCPSRHIQFYGILLRVSPSPLTPSLSYVPVTRSYQNFCLLSTLSTLVYILPVRLHVFYC